MLFRSRSGRGSIAFGTCCTRSRTRTSGRSSSSCCRVRQMTATSGRRSRRRAGCRLPTEVDVLPSTLQFAAALRAGFRDRSRRPTEPHDRAAGAVWLAAMLAASLSSRAPLRAAPAACNAFAKLVSLYTYKYNARRLFHCRGASKGECKCGLSAGTPLQRLLRPSF